MLFPWAWGWVLLLIQTTALSQDLPGNSAAANSGSVCTGIQSVSITPNNVIGGSQSKGVIQLKRPAPAGGFAVLLSSENAAVAEVDESVRVVEGMGTAEFLIRTAPVRDDTHVFISAFCSKAADEVKWAKRGQISVRGPRILSLESPKILRAGDTGRGVITLNGAAPPGGLEIELQANFPVIVPREVKVIEGESRAEFTIRSEIASGSRSSQISVRGEWGSAVADLLVTQPDNEGTTAPETSVEESFANSVAPDQTSQTVGDDAQSVFEPSEIQPETSGENSSTQVTQRTFQVTEDSESLSALTDEGLSSSRDVVSTDGESTSAKVSALSGASIAGAVAPSSTFTEISPTQTSGESSTSTAGTSEASAGYVSSQSQAQGDPIQADEEICNPESVELRPSGAERCFGAIGQACKSQANWGLFQAPPLLWPVTEVAAECTIQARVSVGSIAHDTCCVRNNNQGLYCQKDPLNLFEEIANLPCHREWRKAVYDSIEGRNWTVQFGPYYQSLNGDDMRPATWVDQSARALTTFGPLGVQDHPIRYYLEEFRSTQRLSAPSGTKVEFSDVDFCKSRKFREEGWCDNPISCSGTMQLGGMSFNDWAAYKDKNECSKYWDVDPRKAACYLHISSERAKWENRKSHWGICE